MGKYVELDIRKPLGDNFSKFKNFVKKSIKPELFVGLWVVLREMLKKGNIIAKTEDFSTDSIITKYLVDTDYVEIYVKDDVIYKTVLEIGNDKIEINYMNVGKVTNPAS